jgi:hypothetical protein
VTVLGIVLVLVVLTGGVALLVRGSNGPVRGPGDPARHDLGGTRTVVLKIDGLFSGIIPNDPSTACRPACGPSPGGPVNNLRQF